MSGKPLPLAAIDVGSNTIHLTVARPAAGGRDVVYLADELEFVRLGEDVSKTGAISPERMERALIVMRHQVDVAHAQGAETILGIATEGVRAAANGAMLVERVRQELGISLELITGEQEAALTYWGATSGLATTDARQAVLDLGGGSLEIVVGEDSHILWRTSLPLGSGVIHDRYAPSDPPDAEELREAGSIVAASLQLLDLPLPVAEAIACGGTATTLAMLAVRALPPEVSAAGNVTGNGNGRVTYLTRSIMDALLRHLQTQAASELAAHYDIEEGRGRLLGAGCVILLAAMQRLDIESLHVRKRGIREGALLAYAHTGDDWLALAARGSGW